MLHHNVDIYIASYPTNDSAEADFHKLSQAASDGFVRLRASALATRGDDGVVDVTQHQNHAGIKALGWGAVGGLLLGLVAPELLIVQMGAEVVTLSAAGTSVAGALSGAGAGGVLHDLVKRHEDHEIAADLDRYLPAGSAAITALVDDGDVAGLKQLLTGATQHVSQAVDRVDIDQLSRALSQAGYDAAGEIGGVPG